MQMTIIKRNGETLTVELSDVDADLAKLHWYMSGSKGKVGRYVAQAIGGRTTYMHRVIAERMGLDLTDSGVSVDHVNGNKLDNRRENLRLATRREQSVNPNDGLRSTNTSGHRGVSWCKASGKWQVHAMTGYRSVYLGSFDVIEDAVARRAEWDASPWEPGPRQVIHGCGTDGGYQQHRRRRESPCDQCRAAHAAAERVRKQKAR
jgi:hypothetical protein